MELYADVEKMKNALNYMEEAESIIHRCENRLDVLRGELKILNIHGVDNMLDKICNDLCREKHETRTLLAALDKCRSVYIENETNLIRYKEGENKKMPIRDRAELQNPFGFDIMLLFMIDKPENMTDEEYLEVLKEITADVRGQRENYWDAKAINCYIEQVDDAISKSVDKDYLEVINDIYVESMMVGSDVYTEMLKKSGYNFKEKVDLVIKQMGGDVDENGMLQLKGEYKFDPNMPPHAEFYDVLSECVTNSYGKGGGIFDDTDRQKVHLFRYYIDYQNISYIRENYKTSLNMTDEEALIAYCEDPLGLNREFMDAESGRLHNKYPLYTTYEEYYKNREQNRKRLTPDFHSEFIIDGDGNFVSQWNVLEWNEDGTVISDYQYYYNKYTGDNAFAEPYTWEEARMQVANT